MISSGLFKLDNVTAVMRYYTSGERSFAEARIERNSGLAILKFSKEDIVSMQY